LNDILVIQRAGKAEKHSTLLAGHSTSLVIMHRYQYVIDIYLL